MQILHRHYTSFLRKMDHGSGKSYRTTFTLLKEKLVKAPILQLPDLSRQFKVYTDASGHALGAILSQTDS